MAHTLFMGQCTAEIWSRRKTEDAEHAGCRLNRIFSMLVNAVSTQFLLHRLKCVFYQNGSHAYLCFAIVILFLCNYIQYICNYINTGYIGNYNSIS